MNTPYYLSAVGNLSAAVTLGQGLPTDINGQPVKYFWADAITEGEYVHPVQKFRLSVDRKRMDAWVDTFRKMKAGGVDVTVNADHSDRARDALGTVVDMKRDGGTLRVLHQLVGDDAIRMAARNKVSLGINPNFVDGKGVSYGDAVIHSALTPVPVVPGQAGLIAASRGQSDEPLVFELAASTGDQMVDLKKIREALGAAADVKDEDVIQQAAAKLGEQKTEKDALLSRATDAETKVKELEGKVVTLSRVSATAPSKPTAGELFFASKAVKAAREDAIKAGAITPAVATAAEARFLRKPVELAKITLSRTVEEDDYRLSQGFADLIDFYEVVKDNKPSPGEGSQTGVQTLSREVPGQLPDEQAKALEAGKKQGEAYRDEQLARMGR